MQRHGTHAQPARRSWCRAPCACISARMDYWPRGCARCRRGARRCRRAATSRATRSGATITRSCDARSRSWRTRSCARVGPFGYRVFVDSAPVLEKALARNAGLGWIGKHTNLIARDAGSWFFLGEILTDLPLPVDEPASAHCGTCRRASRPARRARSSRPYQLDARRCISYLTIEHHRRDSRRAAHGASATASTAATTASSCARGTSSRAPRRTRTSRCATASTQRGSPSCSRWTRGGIRRAHARARRSAASATSAGLRNIAVALGNAPTPRGSPRSAATRGATMRRRWCASTWSGRCRQRSAADGRAGSAL